MNPKITSRSAGRRALLRPLVGLLLAGMVVALAFVWARKTQQARQQQEVAAGQAQLQAGRLADAESALLAVTRDDPDNAAAWEMLAKLYIGTRRYPQAIDPLRRLARLNPETPGVYARLAECLRRAGEPAGALQQAREALQHDPNDIGALTTEALVLRDQDEGAQELACERRLAQLRPNDPTYLRLLAGTLVQSGAYAEALPTLDKLIQVAPDDPSGYSLRGEVRYYLDQTPAGLATAAADCRAALQRVPNAYVPLLYLGRISMRLDRPKDAIAYLLQARRASPGRDDADFVLAEAYDRIGQKDLAEQARKRFLAWRQGLDEAAAQKKRLSLEGDH